MQDFRTFSEAITVYWFSLLLIRASSKYPHNVDDLMTEIGIAQMTISLLGVSMMVIGYLGLRGTLTPRPILIAILLGTAILVAFSIGEHFGKQGWI